MRPHPSQTSSCAAKRSCRALCGAAASTPLPPPPLPRSAGQQLYKEVKQASDSMLGVPSQCVVAKKAGIGFPARGRAQCEWY